MTIFEKPIDFANSIGVSKNAIYSALHRGAVHKEINGTIDSEHPTNLAYVMRSRERQTRQGIKKKEVELKKKWHAAKSEYTDFKGKKKQAQDLAKQVVENQPSGNSYEAINNILGEVMSQKEFEEIRLKKISADLKSFEYTKKIDAIVDIESIHKLFIPFFDIIMTDLVHMPEESAEMIWQRARSSEHPARAIQDELASRIESVIKKAKAAMMEITPEPGKSRKYIILEDNA
jgi:hypothetical protein